MLLCGLPGAGKSTFARNVVRDLAASSGDGCSAVERLQVPYNRRLSGVSHAAQRGWWRRRPFGSVLLPEHCAGLHCVQMLLGSASMPRAVLVELDDIQRRLLASRPAGQETSQESSGQADENAELTAWRKARGLARRSLAPPLARVDTPATNVCPPPARAPAGLTCARAVPSCGGQALQRIRCRLP